MGAISADQGTVPTASTKAALLLQRAAGYRHTVNQRLTSPVREICTLGSVGAGGRRLPPATRWYRATGIPTAIAVWAPLTARSVSNERKVDMQKTLPMDWLDPSAKASASAGLQLLDQLWIASRNRSLIDSGSMGGLLFLDASAEAP